MEPIPPIESPFFTEMDLAEDEQFRTLNSEGFLEFDPGIEPELIDRAAQELEEHYPAPGETFYSPRVQDAWKFNDAVKAIACHPKILRILEQAYGRRCIPFQTLNFKLGTQQKTHSDTIHFHSFPERFMCGVWVALEDIDEQNGPLSYYPGSHRLPCYDNGHLGISAREGGETYDQYPVYEDFIERVVQTNDLKQKLGTIKKGRAILWTANLLHGGSPVLDPSRTRYSQVTHYYFENCVYYTPLHSDLPLGNIYTRSITDIRTGERIQNLHMGQPTPKFRPLLAKLQRKIKSKVGSAQK